MPRVEVTKKEKALKTKYGDLTPSELSARFGPHHSMADTLSRKKQWMVEFMHLPTNLRVWFHGYITQQGDTFTSNWTDEEVFGRMDPISIFKNTKREISLGFKVVANNEQEAKENVSSINRLVQFLYPVYRNISTKLKTNKKTNNLSQAQKARVINTITTAQQNAIGKTKYMVSSPLLKLRFTNLIHAADSDQKSGVVSGGLVVKVNGGLSAEPIKEDGFMGSEQGMVYPQAWQITCNFTVFHTHTLGFDENNVDDWVSFSSNYNGNKYHIDRNFPYGVTGIPDRRR